MCENRRFKNNILYLRLNLLFETRSIIIIKEYEKKMFCMKKFICLMPSNYY